MTLDEYRDFLETEIRILTERLEAGGFGNPDATARMICEKNRLVDRLFDLDHGGGAVASVAN